MESKGIVLTLFLLVLLSSVHRCFAWDVWSMPIGDQLDDGSNSTRRSAHNSVVSFLFIVGFDQIGHSDVSPMVSAIAQSCEQHVEHKPEIVADIMGLPDPEEVDKRLSLYMRRMLELSAIRKTKAVVISHLTLPRDGMLTDTAVQKERDGAHYTFRKLFKRGLKEDVPIKFLFLKRDLYDTVASLTGFNSREFQNRAKNLQSLAKFVVSEYEAISSKRVDSWSALHYDWFANVRNCTILASAIIDFAGWDQCDVEYACQALKRTTFSAKKPPVDEKNLQYAQTVNYDTEIPFMDLTRTDDFRFKPWKSTAAVGEKTTPWVTSVAAPLAVRAVEQSPDRRTGRGSRAVESRLWKPREKGFP